MKRYKNRISILVILICIRLIPFAQQNIYTADTIANLQAQELMQIEQKKGYSNNHPKTQWFPKASLGLFNSNIIAKIFQII